MVSAVCCEQGTEGMSTLDARHMICIWCTEKANVYNCNDERAGLEYCHAFT